MAFLIGIIFTILFIMFMDDGLFTCMRKDWKLSLKYFSSCLVCVASLLAMSGLPSYTEQRAIVIILANLTIANCSLSLMLHCMANKKFRFVKQLAFLPLILPLVAYYVFGVSGETEKMLSCAMCIL